MTLLKFNVDVDVEVDAHVDVNGSERREEPHTK